MVVLYTFKKKVGLKQCEEENIAREKGRKRKKKKTELIKIGGCIVLFVVYHLYLFKFDRKGLFCYVP